jgi:putative membrane protein
MKHNKILITTIVTALITFAVNPALIAADEVKPESTTAAANATADATFMTDATRAGLMEIKAGDIAEGKTKRDNVKEFAKAMQRDHTDVNKNLQTLADRMTMKLPKDLGDHQPFIDGLKAKTDADFDRTYIAATVMSHHACIGMFEKFAASTKNADLKAFAENTLPGLRTHLKNAEVLLETLGGAKGTAVK